MQYLEISPAKIPDAAKKPQIHSPVLHHIFISDPKRPAYQLLISRGTEPSLRNVFLLGIPPYFSINKLFYK
jgi:hypothetical protein